MATNAVCLKIDGNDFAHALQQAQSQVNDAEGEVVLDFSSVQRIDAVSLKAIQELASAANDKAVKVALQGVSVGIYKVLKLAKLSPHFTFLN